MVRLPTTHNCFACGVKNQAGLQLAMETDGKQVWAPFIPLWDKWIPFAFALLAPLCTPWLPDLYRVLLRSRHQVELELLHQDLDRVGRSLPLPPASLAAPAASSPPRLEAAATRASTEVPKSS